MDKPKVGDLVRLNNKGLVQIYGTDVGLSHMKTKVMRVIQVDDESMTEPEKTYIVQVDDPDINMFMIDNWCFDKVG